MTLRQGEYEITDDAITIKKEVLEQLRDHYYNVAIDMELSEQDEKQMFYLGKHEVIVNLLKMFESLEG